MSRGDSVHATLRKPALNFCSRYEALATPRPSHSRKRPPILSSPARPRRFCIIRYVCRGKAIVEADEAGILIMRGDAMRLTERIKKRRADFWAALGDDGNNGIEELLKLYWWWGSDTADFFFDKFVPAGLSLENLEAEKKNAIGTMLTAVREDISQLPRTVKAQRRDMDRLAVSVADAAFDARLAERRHYVVLARPL